MNISRNEKFLISIIIVFYLPFILLDVPFRDDLSRTYWGFVGLSQLGRPLADFVYNIITFGHEGVNISPLPKIISLLCLCISSLLVYRRLFSSLGISGLISTTIFFANPFIIQNFAYQYDCLPMALSILTATSAVMFRPKNNIIYFATSALFLTCAISLYQASIFISSSLFICLFSIKLKNKTVSKDDFTDCLLTISSAFISIIAYLSVIMITGMEAAKRAKIVDLNSLINNINFLSYKLEDLYHSISFIFIIILVILLSSLIRIIIKNGIVIFSLLLLTLILLIISSLLPSIILCEGFAGPRVLMSIGSIFLFIAIQVKGKENHIYAMLISIIMIHSTSISYAFSANIHAQYDRYRTISSLVLADINNKVPTSTKRIFVYCKSTPSQRELVYHGFNNHIAWLNPEEAWAIRFYIRNSGESRIVHSWDDCITGRVGKIEKENSFYKLIIKDNDAFFLMK